MRVLAEAAHPLTPLACKYSSALRRVGAKLWCRTAAHEDVVSAAPAVRHDESRHRLWHSQSLAHHDTRHASVEHVPCVVIAGDQVMWHNNRPAVQLGCFPQHARRHNRRHARPHGVQSIDTCSAIAGRCGGGTAISASCCRRERTRNRSEPERQRVAQWLQAPTTTCDISATTATAITTIGTRRCARGCHMPPQRVRIEPTRAA